MKRTGPRTEPWGSPQVRSNEGKLCGRISTVDMRDDRYEVNNCSETQEMPNQVERPWNKMEWSRVSKASDGSRRQRKETCCIEMALEKWSCREGSVVSVE